MLTIFLKELKLNRRSLVFWLIAIALGTAMGVAEYPFLAENLDVLMSSLNLLPRVILVIFGIQDITLSTSLGYFLVMAYYLSFAAFLFAAHSGYSITARESKDRITDFLYTKPFTRSRIILAKVLAVAVNNLILAAGTALLIIAVMLPVLNALDLIGAVILVCTGMFLTQMVFAAAGVFSAYAVKNINHGGRAAFAAVLATYALAVGFRTASYRGYLNIFSPWQYFTPAEAAVNGLSPFFILLSLAIAGGLSAAAVLGYRKKDLV